MSVKIFSGNDFFEAPAKVVYAHPNLGMGVEFHDVKPFFQNVLKKWVLAAMVGKPAAGGAGVFVSANQALP